MTKKIEDCCLAEMLLILLWIRSLSSYCYLSSLYSSSSSSSIVLFLAGGLSFFGSYTA